MTSNNYFDPWAWRSDMDAPKPSNYLAPTLKPGPEPTGYDKTFDTAYNWLGGTPDKRRLAEVLAGAFNVGTLGMATGAYDGAKDLAQTGRPASLAMALMPGARVAAPVAKVAEKAAERGIRAFHGSPHDFDRFDLSKIGTGEGAQAYGHGLYFAENEGVARDYRNKLSGKPAPVSQGDADAYRAAVLSKLGGGADAVPSIEMKQPGHMYEVNINANPDDFLDWDKPRDALAPNLQEWVRSNHPDVWDKAADGASLYQHLQTKLTQPIPPDPVGTPKGWGFVQRGDEGQPTASRLLREAGIPGIRYLDQGSRSAGEGSRNYVVFDDSLIEILRKYGLMPPAAVGAVAASQSDPAQASP